MTGKQFKISVVIPVYNVELYVAETIESVIRQDIGFEENVQIVLVNDGSPDGSGQICEEYAKRYPENIHHAVETAICYRIFCEKNGALKDTLPQTAGQLKTFMRDIW